MYDIQVNNFLFKTTYHNIKFFYGDGFEGLPSFAPFDKIIITAAAPFVLPKLVHPLRVGGIMVVPVDDNDKHHQRMLRTTKFGDGIDTETFDNFSLVPMLKGKIIKEWIRLPG